MFSKLYRKCTVHDGKKLEKHKSNHHCAPTSGMDDRLFGLVGIVWEESLARRGRK